MSWDEIGPKVQAGKLVPFESYLSQTRAIREAPSLWKDASITNACLADSGTARGALSIKNSEREQAGEIASGVSMVLQLIKPLDSTTPHSHSFWHIYIVIGGEGEAYLSNQAPIKLHQYDVLHVPAFCKHHFTNNNEETPLRFYVLQNLPQMVALGALVREDEVGTSSIYSENSVKTEEG